MRFRISNYLVEIYGGDSSVTDATDPETFRAQILLFDFNGNKRRACVRFYDGDTLPADQRDDAGFVTMHLPASMIPSTVDVLRNENPVYIEWKKDQKGPRLTTYLEPVGEGE
jgi:hypothetical protein